MPSYNFVNSKKYINLLQLSFVIVVLFISNKLHSQIEDSLVPTKFENYYSYAREQVHVHLNKSIYVKGESIGFTAYVLDKKSKTLSLNTRNLYAIIKDNNGVVIKSQLLLVKDGIVSGLFDIDDSFSSGLYTVLFYTNWMKNFNEKNYFLQSIRIIDPSTEKQEENPKNSVADLNIQVLPEGGHMVNDVNSFVGIVVKNQFGMGLSKLEGHVINQSMDTITNFKINDVGIGKFAFRPEVNESYFVTLNYDNNIYRQKIPKAKNTGLALSLNTIKDKVFFQLKSNKKTLPLLKDKSFALVLHNGSEMKSWVLRFSQDNLEIVLPFNKSDLFPGMNIFSVFDDKNRPILERLYFNFEDLNVESNVNTSLVASKDSTNIYINVPSAINKNYNNLSVSILPSQTKSYNIEDNIISKVFLKPYVKGRIENAAYYFTNVNPKKQYELDNLLITQGWSSYDWGTIFSSPPRGVYNFEQGISFKATRFSNNEVNLLVQPLKLSKSFYLNLSAGEKELEGSGLFPVDEDQLKISEVGNNGKLSIPKLNINFYPNRIPDFALTGSEDDKQFENFTILFNSSDNILSLEDTQELDEVEIVTSVTRTRYESLKKLTRGTVDIFDEDKRNAYPTFATYIASKGFIVNENLSRTSSGPGSTSLISIYNPQRTSLGSGLQSPLIFLDGVLLSDLTVLYNFRMDIIDYIEIDKSGAGLGMRGANGVIKIFTDPSKTLKQKSFNEVQIFDFPLKFEVHKTYYTPQYQNYYSDFYSKFGTIGWFPNLQTDSNKNFVLSIPKPKSDSILIFFEGIVGGKTFVYGSKVLKVE